jgi:UDP-N-acetylmuramoylalanine--D-glutamate ligase
MKLDFDKVIIFGMGRTGQACLNFFEELYLKKYDQNLELLCVDSKKMSIGKKFYQDTDKNLEKYLKPSTLVIWSPGIPWDNPFMIKCLEKKMIIWSEIELASRFFKKPIMALTGTNGKTTTVSLIHHIFEKCSVSSFLGGNIGIPFIEAIAKQDEYEVAVLELSSFQLEAIEKFHPMICGILNLFQNHEERYKCYADYVGAKTNIFNNLDAKDTFIRRELEPDLDKYTEKLGSNIITIPSNLKKNKDFWGELDYQKFPLRGDHNLENLAIAKVFLSIWGISDKDIEFSMQNFKAVAFRLQEIYFNKKKRIYNDSKSTNWDATNIALKSFPKGELPILLMGGKLREDSSDKVQADNIKAIADSSKMIITFGEAGPLLSEFFESHTACHYRENLTDVIKLLSELNVIEGNELKEHILFSPGHPSFDHYSNYIERGEHFTQLIKAIELNEL